MIFTNLPKKKEAEVYFIFPTISDFHWNADQNQIEILKRKLHETLKIPILKPIKESILPLDCFFDTAYHLNAKGRKINSQKIGKVLIAVNQKKHSKNHAF